MGARRKRWRHIAAIEVQACLAAAAPPAFTFLHGPRWPVSSTALRGKPQPAAEGIKQTNY
jgi:hypothetical protein